MKFAAALVAAAGGIPAGFMAAPAVAQTPSAYIALALADGPTVNERLVLAFRGSDPANVLKLAVDACYRRAASGYLHTCQAWYGDAWIVAAACQVSPADVSPAIVKFGIGDDPNSPEAAKAKAVEAIRKAGNANVANCRVVVEYSATDMKTARSVATDDDTPLESSPRD